MNRPLVALVALAALLVSASSALAEPATTVFPLSSTGLPPEQASAPTQLTAALARAIGGQVSSVSIEDAGALLECDVETSACLAAIAQSVATPRLVFGAITASDRKIYVNLTRFAVGTPREQRTFELAAQTPTALADELTAAVAPLFDLEPKRPAATAAPAPAVSPGAITQEPRLVVAPPGERRAGGIKRSTGVILAAGLVTAAVGVGFLLSARDLEDQVAKAPRVDREDFDRLQALEDRGQWHRQLGATLTIGGGSVALVGLTLALVQRTAGGRAAGATQTTLRATPVAGGAIVGLSMEMP